MGLTYTVRGADGKEYAHVTLDQLVGWIREGRLLVDHPVKRSDMNYWAKAGDFTELQAEYGIVPGDPGAEPVAAAKPVVSGEAMGRIKSGGSWFYWIAGLSLINSLAALSGSSWRFIIGLGMTQVFDRLSFGAGGAVKAAVLGLDLVVVGVFVLFGVFACQGRAWAFIVGMVCFALDGIISVLFGDWLSVGFHALILFFLFRGLAAARALKR